MLNVETVRFFGKWTQKAALLLLLVLAIVPVGFAQYTNKQIDSLIAASTSKYRIPGNVQEGRDFYLKMLEEARRNNYSRGIALSQINLGNVYHIFGDYVESIHSLDSALVLANDLKYTDLEVLGALELAKNYIALGYFQNALGVCQSAIDLELNEGMDPGKENRLGYLYSTAAVAHDKMKNPKPFLEALKKSYVASPNPFVASRMAKYFMEYEMRPDSARKYLDQAQVLWSKGQFGLHQKSILLRNEGRYSSIIKDFPKAIEFYNESIGISNKLRNLEEEVTTNKMLFDVYKALNDKVYAALVLERYTELTDSLSRKKIKAVEVPVSKWLEKKDSDHRAKIYRILFVIFCLCVLFAWMYYQVYLRNEIVKSDQMSFQNGFSNEVIQDEAKRGYGELFQLARCNDPAFYLEFIRCFPQFEMRLFAINDDLTPVELTLLGYSFLGFSTKKIAEYTFRSVRTIENGKYKIRKKLNVPSEEDIGFWMRKLLNADFELSGDEG